MTDRVMSIFVLAVLAVFLGILAWRVPRLDLGAVIVLTYLLTVYDFFSIPRDQGASLPKR